MGENRRPQQRLGCRPRCARTLGAGVGFGRGQVSRVAWPRLCCKLSDSGCRDWPVEARVLTQQLSDGCRPTMGRPGRKTGGGSEGPCCRQIQPDPSSREGEEESGESWLSCCEPCWGSVWEEPLHRNGSVPGAVPEMSPRRWHAHGRPAAQASGEAALRSRGHRQHAVAEPALSELCSLS